MKILIFGASGSGTTTLANSLSQKTNFPHLDIDNYYWEITNPIFQKKVEKEVSQRNVLQDFQKQNDVVVSGSMVSWGEVWVTAFDLVIFIYLKNDIRMQRLKEREVERYGDKLLSDKVTQENSKAFLEWANNYDDFNFDGRSLKIYEDWMEKIHCPILKLNGSIQLEVKVNSILDVIDDKNKTQKKC